MTPTELKNLLAKYEITPIRDRGQHFLLDERVVAKMVEVSGAGENDHVVEIGPGPGILTEALLGCGAQVTAVELDRKLQALLIVRFAGKKLRLLAGDALSYPNAELADGPYRLIANLPYSITSAVFEKFLLAAPKPRTITVMIQREVADRILAGPGDMSSLAVMVQTLARPKWVVDVPPSSFFPPPKVRSTVIHMEVLSDGQLADFFGSVPPERYFSVVRTAFAGKRRQLKNTLKKEHADPAVLEKAFSIAKISPQARPEELRPEEWLALVSSLIK